MHSLPFEIASVIIAFQPLFSKSVFEHVQVLLLGAILTPGRRTVAAVLRTMGLGADRCWANFHRVLNRDRWSARQGARILLGLLLRAFVPQEAAVVLGIDETIERRWGQKISARGIYRDPLRSSHSHVVKASGLRWISVMLLCPIRWAGRVWALPFLTALAPSKRYYLERGEPTKTLLERAAEVLRLVVEWLPGRRLVVVADSSYAALEFLEQVRHSFCFITRLRLDAALYEPAPARKAGQTGRPRKKGKRLPTLQQLLEQPPKRWKRLRLASWYGQGPKLLEVLSDTAVWYHSGLPAVPLRWVLIRDPLEQFEPQALLCTDLTVEPIQILAWFVWRWQMEVTFEESRAHLGIETQRQWTDKAIARSTPALLALYSIVTLMAERLMTRSPMPVRSAAWYPKHQPTFSDAIALVRRSVWGLSYFSTSPHSPEIVKIPRALLQRLTDTICYAA